MASETQEMRDARALKAIKLAIFRFAGDTITVADLDEAVKAYGAERYEAGRRDALSATWVKDVRQLCEDMEHTGPCWEYEGQDQRYPDECYKCYLAQIIEEIPLAEKGASKP